MWYFLNEDKTISPAPLGPDGLPTIEVMIQFNDHDGKRVARDEVGKYLVSTVFLGLDHGYEGVPLLFETMVFGNDPGVDIDMERYSTYQEAVDGHNAMVQKIMLLGSGISKEELEAAKSVIEPLLKGQ